MKRNIPVLIMALLLTACIQQSRPIPESVNIILEKSGENRAELEKVLDAFRAPEDAEKYDAACFLIENMSDKCFAGFEVSDSSGNIIGFSALDYPDYNAMTRAWDSIAGVRGKLHQQRIELVYDYEIITAEYLIDNINRAFKVWKNNPWTQFLSFDQFCEYILPYRSTNEPLEEWRSYFEQDYAWLKDSLKDELDPVEACRWINSDIKSWFSFDPRFYEHATDLGLAEMTEGKMGRCEDMTNLAIYAMRANGIAVMSDYTPYWAKSGNNHAWNAVMGADGKVVIFMGGESNPGDYRLPQAKAKVYRKTFALQSATLAAILEEGEKAPPYINRNGIVDVTREYVPVSDVLLHPVQVAPEGERFAYICVFNTGEWKAIHWSHIGEDGGLKFTDMGTDIAYLPAYYINGEIIPAGKQFILTEEGEVAENKPDFEKPVTLKLTSTTKRVTAETTDFAEQVFLKEGETYELFYWNDKWVSMGKQKASGSPLVFENAPSGAMYWLINTTPTKDRPERIFTLNDDGRQIWW